MLTASACGSSSSTSGGPNASGPKGSSASSAPVTVATDLAITSLDPTPTSGGSQVVFTLKAPDAGFLSDDISFLCIVP